MYTHIYIHIEREREKSKLEYVSSEWVAAGGDRHGTPLLSACKICKGKKQGIQYCLNQGHTGNMHDL